MRPEAMVVLRGRGTARAASTAGRLRGALGSVGATPVAGHVEPEEDSVSLDALCELGLRKRRGLSFSFALGRHRLDDRGDLDLVLVIRGSGELVDFGIACSIRRRDRRRGGRHANWGRPARDAPANGGGASARQTVEAQMPLPWEEAQMPLPWEEAQERM